MFTLTLDNGQTILTGPKWQVEALLDYYELMRQVRNTSGQPSRFCQEAGGWPGTLNDSWQEIQHVSNKN